MSTHDPENYRFSTPTYVLLYGTLLTAYYMYVRRVESAVDGVLTDDL